jgi:hypothetical protein
MTLAVNFLIDNINNKVIKPTKPKVIKKENIKNENNFINIIINKFYKTK